MLKKLIGKYKVRIAKQVAIQCLEECLYTRQRDLDRYVLYHMARNNAIDTKLQRASIEELKTAILILDRCVSEENYKP